jgi:hypothetical protein
MFKLSTSALLTVIVALNSSLAVVSSSSSASVLHSTAGADIEKFSRALNKAITNGSYDSLPSSLSAKLRSLDEEMCQNVDSVVLPNLTAEELASVLGYDENNIPVAGSSVTIDYSKAPNALKVFGEACSTEGGDFYLMSFSLSACEDLKEGFKEITEFLSGVDIAFKDLPLCFKGCGRSASDIERSFETGANADADCKASIKAKNSGNVMGGHNAFFAIGALVATITMAMM